MAAKSIPTTNAEPLDGNLGRNGRDVIHDMNSRDQMGHMVLNRDSKLLTYKRLTARARPRVKTRGNRPGRPETHVLKLNLQFKVAHSARVCLRDASQEMKGDILKKGEPEKCKVQNSARTADNHKCSPR